MIARGEDEFELFQRLDEERRKAEERGRLMAEDELPEWMLKEEESVSAIPELVLPDLLSLTTMIFKTRTYLIAFA